ncbi:PAS domain-containing hybrid sensor histidine kinase/response regulator [Desulfopila aestuarii]|uniref:histidine kinase n=1 Tax=Desulfopila aestuarii DSM 18488 TaxID=1121416 RepID=A0A1M7Y4H3_9BACT|nr:PAS domain-containing hybrid sensor histidine kinase/response regulator [Desulfopila aestuarii]SHO47145.1 Response regulator receiver domain-containing protein [Desulfopila aestuarii DSM 18488]
MKSDIRFEWEKAVQRLIAVATVLSMVSPLVLYLIFSVAKQKAAIGAEMEVLSHIITEQINQNPDYWTYEDIRLASILRHRPHTGDFQEHRQIFDSNQKLVAENVVNLKLPVLSLDTPVYDAGTTAGFLRITWSIQATLVRAALVFAASCAGGALLYFVLHTFPLRVLRSAFAALHKEKEQATITLGSIADAVITTDTSLNILSLNPAAIEFAGTTMADVAGKPFGDYFRIIRPQTRHSLEELLFQCLQSEKHSPPLLDQAVLERQIDGREYQVEITVSPLYDEQARLLGLVVVLHDVTESRVLEKQLKDKVLELVHIVRYAGVGITFIRDGVIQKANGIAAEILGMPQDEVVGKELSFILKTCLGFTQPLDHIYETLGDGRIFNMEHRAIRADGRQIWLRLIGQAIDPNRIRENGTVWIAQDITRLKQQQEQLEAARLQAEEASRFKSEFLAHVSHELRSPLSGVIGLNRLVLDTELTSLQRQYLTMVDGTVETLLLLINNLLDLSKIESGAMELEEKTFNISSICTYIRNIVTLQVEEKGLNLIFTLAEDVPAKLIGDELRLGQILLNLVSNALKFTSSGSIEVVCEKMSQSESAIQLSFKVIDTGCGMDDTTCKKIFEAFVQASNSVARTHGGSGLGLSICKKLTELMGGEIWVDSVVEKGTTFTFTAWFKTVTGVTTDFSETNPHTEEKLTETRPPMRRILVVDDLPVNQTIAKLLLELDGHTIDVAGNGREALVALAKSTYNVIFMDVQMPGLDGLTATRLIRRCEKEENPNAREDNNLIKALSAKIRGKHIPIIGMTGNAMDEGKQDCYAAGMDGYISKPFERIEMLEALDMAFKQQSSTGVGSTGSPQATTLPA